ncbi:MAG: hypothetical protein JJU11_15705 [Candidatus Sumerlaeia bacterium]|nr:hypothetical protein [Candidatus Sumerlaeia bacterium]
MRFFQILATLMVAAVISGCAMSRTTTTDRTAIEVALLTQTASEAIRSLPITSTDMGSKSYVIKDDAVAAPEKAFILSELHDLLLGADALVLVGENEPDVTVEPRINFAHIDDDKFLIGIPAVPLPVPGAGTFNTPEIALFAMDTQKGRSRISLYGYESDTGKRVFNATATPSEHRFRRYRFLFFFSFRTTTLPDPF